MRCFGGALEQQGIRIRSIDTGMVHDCDKQHHFRGCRRNGLTWKFDQVWQNQMVRPMQISAKWMQALASRHPNRSSTINDISARFFQKWKSTGRYSENIGLIGTRLQAIASMHRGCSAWKYFKKHHKRTDLTTSGDQRWEVYWRNCNVAVQN